jgi:hypothetical protein
MQNCSKSGKPYKRRYATLAAAGNLINGNPEPSLLTEEGVETRRAAPNPRFPGHGEGIVQTPNLDEGVAGRFSKEGGESRRGKKIRWSQGRVGSTPSAGTKILTNPSFSGRIRSHSPVPILQ